MEKATRAIGNIDLFGDVYKPSEGASKRPVIEIMGPITYRREQVPMQ